MNFMLLQAGQYAHNITTPLVLEPSLWMRPDYGVFTGGSRTLVAPDKSSFQIADASQTGLDPGTSDFSICGWVYWTGSIGTAQWVVAKGSNGLQGYGIRLGTDGLLRLELVKTSQKLCNIGTLTANTWNFFAVTCDRDGNAIGYLNAVAGTPLDISSEAASINTADAFCVGSFYSLYQFGGSIANLAFASRIWTPAEITFLYNSGNGRTYAECGVAGTDGANLLTSLVSYWNCNEQDPTAGLTDQHAANDLTRTAAELLTNTGFESPRTGITGASFAAGDKAHLEIADNAALDLGTGDFVINANVLRTSVGTTQAICGKYQDASNYWWLFFNTSNYVTLRAWVGGVAVLDMVASTTVCSSTSTKYHIQVVVDRANAANCRILVNGVSQDFSLSPYAPELVTNGTFDTDASWDKGAGWTIDAADSNVATHAAGSGSSLDQAVASISIGAKYTATYTLSSVTGGGFIFNVGDAGSGTTRTTSNTYTETIAAAGTVKKLYLYGNATFAGNVDSVSVKQHIVLDAVTNLDNTGKFFVAQAGNATAYFDGRIAMLGIGKPADVTAAAVATAITNIAGTAGLGQYYGEQSSADKTALAWSAFWDLTEASGNRTDKVSSLVLGEVLTTNLVTNSTFDSATTGWTSWRSGVLTSVAGGESGNALQIESVADDYNGAYQSIATVAGRRYSFRVWQKNGTSAGLIRLESTLETGNLYAATANSAGGAEATTTVSATSTAIFVRLATATPTTGVTTLFDGVALTAASIPCASDADVFWSWNEPITGGGLIDIDTTTYDAGVIACRLRRPTSGDATGLAQSILTTGNAYALTFKAKISDDSGASELRSYLGSSNAQDNTLTTGFATYTHSGTATSANLSLYVWTQGVAKTIWVDTVSCKSAAVAVGNGPAEAVATNSGSGTGLDGTFVGVSAAGLITNWKTDVPTPLAGAGGYSFLFDGVNDYITVGTPMNVGADGSFTLSMWFKTSDAVANERICISNYQPSTELYSIGVSSAHKLVGTTRDSASAQIISTSAASVNDGVWHLGTLVRDGVNNVQKLYLDGSEVDSDADTRTGDFTPATTNIHYIGCGGFYSGSPTQFFPGSIDDVRIYSTALSAAQIAQLYAGSEATGATPVGHWKFDDGPFGIPGDGEPVWGWESQDGYRYQFINSTGANRITHRVLGINGYPAEEGDGVNDIMRVADTDPMTVPNPAFMAVVRVDDAVLGTPATQAIMAVQDEGSANNFVWFGLSADGKLTIQGNSAGTAFTVTGATVLSDMTNYILTAYWDGTNWQLWINDVPETVTRTGTEVIPASISGLDSTTLFARYSNATASAWFKGRIAEPFADTMNSARVRQLIRLWKRRYAI